MWSPNIPLLQSFNLISEVVSKTIISCHGSSTANDDFRKSHTWVYLSSHFGARFPSTDIFQKCFIWFSYIFIFLKRFPNTKAERLFKLTNSHNTTRISSSSKLCRIYIVEKKPIILKWTKHYQGRISSVWGRDHWSFANIRVLFCDHTLNKLRNPRGQMSSKWFDSDLFYYFFF